MSRNGLTIAAIATNTGGGAVSIVRLSGLQAHDVFQRVFSPLGGFNKMRPRRAVLGRVIDPESGALIDEALGLWFPGPQSFTGEDAAEIQGHGGTAAPALILEALLKAGAVLAEPGEFTRRAFMNGRLDLTQAEAVADLVAAGSAAEVSLAARQLAGGLSGRIKPVHQAILSALVDLEAAIDFSEDVEPLQIAPMKEALLSRAVEPLERLLADGLAGRPFKNGLSLALIGAPNVGKSSLFNALAGADRAMVSNRPGTTRDFITTSAAWQGLRVELCDTAGLSDAPVDELDALGQERARAQAGQADIALWVRDCAKPGETLPAADEAGLKGRLITVWNKMDLAAPPDDLLGRETGRSIAVSARTGQGLEELKAMILRAATGREEPSPPEIVPSLRHQAAIKKSLEALRATVEAIEQGQPPDICAFELKYSLDALDLICGRTSPDDLLNEIFSRFCLGK